MIQRRISTLIIAHTCLFVTTAIMLFPILWMFSVSLKPESSIFNNSLFFLPLKPSLKAYEVVLTSAPIGTWFKNSLYIDVVKTSLEIVLAVFAAFAFARFEFTGKRMLFYFVLATMLLPPQAMMLPMYITINLFDWIDTFAGVIIPYAASGYCIFMLRQAFMKIPREMVEASEIDGCGPLKSLFLIYLPMSQSIVTALMVILFAGTWNEYYWTWLVLIDKSKYTMPVAVTFFQSDTGIDTGIQYAATLAVAALTTIPVLLLYIAAQKKFVEGFASSGIKG